MMPIEATSSLPESFPEDEPASAQAEGLQGLDRLLLHLAGRLADAAAPDEALHGALATLQNTLQVDCIGLSLMPSGSDDPRSMRHYHATFGPCPARELLQIEPALFEPLRRGETVVYPPAGKSLPPAIAAAGIGSVLILPLHGDSRWLGALGMAAHEPERQWPDAALVSLQSFGRLVALTMQHTLDVAKAGGEESWLRMALEGGGVDVGVWDLTTGDFHTTYNVAKRALANTTVAPASSYPDYMELVHPGHRERLMLALEAAINGSQPTCQVEHILVQPNGQQMWMEFTGRVRRDANGAPRLVEGSLVDITKRKLIEQELSQQRQLLLRHVRLLEQAENVAAIGGWEWDLVNDTLYFTPELYRIYGFAAETRIPPAEEVIAMCTPESETALMAAIHHALTTGASYDLNIELVNAQDKPVSLRATGFAEIENGRAIRLYGIVQDITQTQTLKRQLREVQARYHTSHTPDPE